MTNPDHYERIETSLHALARADLPLAELARQASLSPFHYQRTFHRLVGVTPHRFRQLLSVEAARRALLASKTVLEAAWDAGLSGSSRLHDAMLRLERMTPGELKAGPKLSWAVAKTDLGPLTIAATDRGICGASFDGVESLAERWPGSTFKKGTLPIAQLERLLDGARLRQPLALVLRGTDFQVAVWRALLEVPSGAVTTYAELAKATPTPSAVRAVASAVAANHLAVLIPCHRVIRATGALGEYRWGSARKAALLARELSGAAPGGV